LRRFRLAFLLLLPFVVGACSSQPGYTVVSQDPSFSQLDLSEARIAVVPPADGLRFSRAAIAVVDNPAQTAMDIMEGLDECFRGDFPCCTSIEASVRAHCRRNIRYLASEEDLAEVRTTLVFTEGSYGLLEASIVRPAALRELSEARSWDYLVFLEDLMVDQYYTDAYEPITGSLRTKGDLKLVSQAFLVSPATGTVLYHGYVTGEADQPLYSKRMEHSFVGHLVRGPLGLR